MRPWGRQIDKIPSQGNCLAEFQAFAFCLRLPSAFDTSPPLSVRLGMLPSVFRFRFLPHHSRVTPSPGSRSRRSSTARIPFLRSARHAAVEMPARLRADIANYRIG